LSLATLRGASNAFKAVECQVGDELEQLRSALDVQSPGSAH
jgi:hypothetical protein